MNRTVQEVRAELQNAYAPLRIRILQHYQAAWRLAGTGVAAEAYKLPKKLGRWHETHTRRVHASCPELQCVLDEIRELCLRRDPNYIKRNHVPQRPGRRRAEG